MPRKLSKRGGDNGKGTTTPSPAPTPAPASASVSTGSVSQDSDKMLLFAGIGVLLIVGGILFYFYSNQNASGTSEGEEDEEQEETLGSCFSEYNKGTFNCPSNKTVNRTRGCGTCDQEDIQGICCEEKMYSCSNFDLLGNPYECPYGDLKSNVICGTEECTTDKCCESKKCQPPENIPTGYINSGSIAWSLELDSHSDFDTSSGFVKPNKIDVTKMKCDNTKAYQGSVKISNCGTNPKWAFSGCTPPPSCKTGTSRIDPQNTLPSGTAQRSLISNCRDVDFDTFDSEAEDKQTCQRYFQADGNFCKWHNWGIGGTCASDGSGKCQI